MLQENEIARRLHEYMSERMTGIKVREVRIGVGYAAVALDKNLTGLAAVIRENLAISLWSCRKGRNAFRHAGF